MQGSQESSGLLIIPGDATDTYQSCLPIQLFRPIITTTALGRESMTI